MSFGFGFALPAYPLRGGGGNNPFNQDGPTLDMSFVDGATNVGDQLGADTYTLNTDFITPEYQVAAQYAVWENGVGLAQKTFAQIVTFSRTSGATWFNSAGILQGVDFSVTSNTIGTGSKTFTLDATAGVNRYWTAGDTVLISDQANSANNMVGTVTSYVAATQVLVCNITSTGGSGTFTAWRVSSTMPRFDYDPATLLAHGFLIEDLRTNLVLQSEDFATTWTTSSSPTITTNTTVAPNGTTTADTIASTAAGSYVAQIITFTGDGTKAYSFFIKAATSGNTRVFIRDTTVSASRGQVDIVWTGGVPSPTVANGSLQSLQACPNGWYKVSVIVDSVVAANTNQMRIQPDSVSGTGDIIIWGFQAENGVFSTSYIPTTVAQATRNADVASVNTLSPWYNASAGTLFSEWSVSGVRATNNQRVWSLSDGTNSQFIAVRIDSVAQIRGEQTGGSTVPTTVLAVASANTVYKTGVTFQAGDSAICLGGGTVYSNTTFAYPAGINKLTLGNLATGSFELSGHLRRITYYPRRLSNTDLQTITI